MTLCLQEFAVPNCVEGATYDPWKALSDVTTYHNYRWVVVGPLELSVEVFFAEKETFLLTQNVPNAEKSVRPTFAWRGCGVAGAGWRRTPPACPRCRRRCRCAGTASSSPSSSRPPQSPSPGLRYTHGLTTGALRHFHWSSMLQPQVPAVAVPLYDIPLPFSCGGLPYP